MSAVHYGSKFDGLHGHSLGEYYPVRTWIIESDGPGGTRVCKQHVGFVDCSAILSFPSNAELLEAITKRFYNCYLAADSAVNRIIATGGFTLRINKGFGCADHKDCVDFVERGGFAGAVYFAGRKGFEQIIDRANCIDVCKVASYIYKQSVVSDKFDRNTDYIGGWVEKGKLYLDVSRGFTDENSCRAFCIENGQLAYYDSSTGESVYLPRGRFAGMLDYTEPGR